MIDLAGLMLEDVSAVIGSAPDAATAALLPPGVWFDTAEVRTRRLQTCEDTDGSTFQRTFIYDCEERCLDGSSACDEAARVRRCYWETQVPISADSLERFVAGTPAGFAAGNYNYRLETLGVNLVGTGLRDCSRESGSSPSTCYSSGNFSFSAYHGGEFVVRDARGARYRTPIHPGRIESARALAAERYLTNPLSSADRASLDGFTRPDFQGRPLSGTVTLRIWDEPSLRMDRLEDIQIVLGYRYWQHQR